MNHLKTYESFESQSAASEILEIFQDIKDEYSLEQLPDDYDWDVYPGIYYQFEDFYETAEASRRSNGTLRRCHFELTLHCPTEWYPNLDELLIS